SCSASTRDEKGCRDVIWDDEFEDGHDGEANDGSFNHYYVPKSKLELVKDEPSAQPATTYAIGTIVKTVGDNYDRVTGAPDDAGHVAVEFDNGQAARLPVVDLIEAWEPKVGERVRLVKDGKSTTGAVGKIATLEAWSDGSFIDGDEYL